MHVRLLTASAALLLSVCAAGCSSGTEEGDETEERTLDLDSQSEGTPSSSADPDADAGSSPGALPSSYPEESLQFTELPDVRGAERLALRTYVDFERGFNLASQENSLNDLVTENSVGDARAFVEAGIDARSGDGTTYRGELRIAVTSVESAPGQTVLGLCTDNSDLERVTDGEVTPQEGPAERSYAVTVGNPGGAWQVAQYVEQDGFC